MAISGQPDLNHALAWLSEKVDLVAIKQGEKGAWLKQADRSTLFQAAASMEVVDTVGAGDSFDSGLIYGYLNKWPLQKILKLGVACGSLSTRRAGGTGGQATLVEAIAFIEKNLI
jgi:sugar/nucleoside kinase (ribokinase family)